MIEPDDVDDAMLATVHEDEFIAAVRCASADPAAIDVHRGLGTDDVPTFRGMHEASRAVCGATLAATRAVYEGRALHAVNLAGGLHHAMPGAASGFCVYNDIAVSIQWLLDHGVERVAYVDVDVHHGDGVQAAFWDEPRVLTISVHESGRALFPGTGFPSEIGGPDALGSAANLALPPGTGDDGWLRAFSGVVPPLLEEFRPSILVTQQGCDTHLDDPLAHLALSIDGQRLTYEALHDLAHRVVRRPLGRRSAEAATRGSTSSRVPGRTSSPSPWAPRSRRRRRCRSRGARSSRIGCKVPAPSLMTDGREPRVRSWEAGYDPADPIDAAVLRTREAVFPWHGLNADPYHGF